MEWHPDKHALSSVADRQVAHDKFLLVAASYSLLRGSVKGGVDVPNGDEAPEYEAPTMDMELFKANFKVPPQFGTACCSVCM